MFRFACLVTLFVGAFVFSALAEEISITETLVVELPLSEGWTIYLEPPDALVKEMAIHVAHEPAAANASAEQIEAVTRKRMATNEATIYHAESGAHLDVDFSALDPGASAPTSRALRNSAKYAAQSLEGEEDVSEVVWEVSSAEVEGAPSAFKLVANYKRHGLPVKFVGIVGYVEGYWFFFYYTDPSQVSRVFDEMHTMLARLAIRSSLN